MCENACVVCFGCVFVVFRWLRFVLNRVFAAFFWVVDFWISRGQQEFPEH